MWLLPGTGTQARAGAGTRVRGTAPYACENARIALSAAVEIADNEIPLPVLIRGTDYFETDAIAERAERPARKPASPPLRVVDTSADAHPQR